MNEKTINDLFSDYLKWASLKNKDTFEGERRRIRALQKGFDYLGLTDPEAIGENNIFDLIIYFKKQDIKNSTINTRLILLYTVFKKFKLSHLLPERERLYDDTSSFERVPDTELNQILKYLKKIPTSDSNLFRIKVAIYLMLETGVRANELRHIRIDNIDYNNKRILLIKTKNRKKRVVPFSTLTASVLADLINMNQNNEFLFWNNDKNAIWTHKKLHYWLSKVKDGCDIKKLHCHQFRKNFATKLLEGGCALSTIMKLLGHSSLIMTQIYLDLNDMLVFNDYELHQIEY